MNKLAGLAVASFLACTALISIWMVSYVQVRVLNKAFFMWSGSMRPAILEGSFVVVQTREAPADIVAEYGTGDIIAFHNPTDFDVIVIYRTIDKEQSDGTWYFRTKGDANNSPDYWRVPSSYIVGKVIAVNSFPAIVYFMSIFWFAGIAGLASVSAVLFLMARERHPKQETTEPLRRELRPTPQSARLFCRYCGAENKSDAVFCERCGKKIV